MSAPSRTRRASRIRPSRRPARRTRRGRFRLAFIDRFMLAGIAGGSVYLVLLHLLGVAPRPAAAFGLVVFGFALGVLARMRYLPRPRLRITWRSR
ncbi:hypothetical protein Acsp03_27490 [Actinomadura sp. NBRC 104412]|uniref:hypothetical protein n=1 Tax=unclassified Actinomadura TaxID=2626254 RepID=UPI0024A2C81F|nr:hypothetical protein [Actinomadura sp. NBRC 104412]GLZ05283.1 hypothetical protein Acsp03_27490 [Actinomadura sp. NBRC 104412]